MKHKLISALMVLALLTACVPDNKKTTDQNNDVTRLDVRGQIFHIPNKYFLAKPRPNENGFLLGFKNLDLQAFDDDYASVPKEELHKNVSILVTAPPKPVSIERFVEFKMKSYSADRKVGSEYGLIHYEQSDEKQSYKDDVWLDIEGGDVKSLIMCHEYMDDFKNHPKCSHFLRQDGLVIDVSFDRSFLEKWKILKKNTQTFMDSIKSDLPKEGM